MTIEESLKRRLAESLQRGGENAFSVRTLRQYLASIAHFRRLKLSEGLNKFHLGARQRPPEDHPKAHPLEPREDMYGTVIPDDQEGSPQEEEES